MDKLFVGIIIVLLILTIKVDHLFFAPLTLAIFAGLQRKEYLGSADATRNKKFNKRRDFDAPSWKISEFTVIKSMQDVAHRMFKNLKASAISRDQLQETLDSLAIFEKIKFNRCWTAEYLPHWHTKLLPEVRELPQKINYLQIGVFEGMSLVYLAKVILAGHDVTVTVIDNFSTEQHFKTEETFDSNMAAMQITPRKMRDESGAPLESFAALNALIAEKEKFDFVYCSGSRKPAICFVDFALLSAVMSDYGYLLFDTYGATWASYSGDISPDKVRDVFLESFKNSINVVEIGDQRLAKFHPLPIDTWTPREKPADCVNLAY